jgi:Rhodopirellula transposase DDE domain
LAGRNANKLGEDKDPQLVSALLALVERGEPESPLWWTTKSLRGLAAELACKGHPCGKDTAKRLLREQGFNIHASAKTMEGEERHPDSQFRYIAAQAREHMDAGQPVISVDTKKREKAGQFG